MLVSINRKIIDKGRITKENNAAFENVNITPEELAEHIKLGHAFCAQLKGPRKSENFLATGFVALDFDDWSLDEAINNDFIQQYASFIYTTPSHQKEGKGDRFRVVFELEEPFYA